MAFKLYREELTHKFIGKSTDTKPTSAPVGSRLYEYDSRLWYITPDGVSWVFYESMGDIQPSPSNSPSVSPSNSPSNSPSVSPSASPST